MGIRRFSQAVVLFPECFSEDRAAKIRKRLKGLMRLTSEVRNRDIALTYLGNAKIKDPILRAGLQRDRRMHEREFTRMIREAEENIEVNKLQREQVEAKNQLESYL